MILIKIICEQCNIEFIGKPNRKYCSILCSCRAHASVAGKKGGAQTKGDVNGQYRHGKRMNGKEPISWRRCWSKTKYALSVGKIKKQPCMVCNNIKVEGHHKDYSKPYDVTWLCRKHHYVIHQNHPSILKEVS